MTSIHVQPTFDLGTRQQKEAERAQIAADVERFERSGGKVQVLGTSPMKKPLRDGKRKAGKGASA